MNYKEQKLINEKDLGELVAMAQNNDSKSLARLFEYIYPKIYTFCFYKVNNEEDAKDLTGEILLKITKSLNRQKGSFLGWIYRIANNSIIDFYRHRARREKVEVSHEPDSNVFYSKATDVEDYLRKEELKLALKKLTEEQRMVTILKFIQGYKNEEVAQIMGKNVNAIKGLQFRALRSLRGLIGENI